MGRVTELSDLLNDLLGNDFKIRITLDCTAGSIEDGTYQKIKDRIDDIDKSARVSGKLKSYTFSFIKNIMPHCLEYPLHLNSSSHIRQPIQ